MFFDHTQTTTRKNGSLHHCSCYFFLDFLSWEQAFDEIISGQSGLRHDTRALQLSPEDQRSAASWGEVLSTNIEFV